MKKGRYKFCPFRKYVKRTATRENGGTLAVGYYDDFKRCLEERCMAYRNGGCMRMRLEESK